MGIREHEERRLCYLQMNPWPDFQIARQARKTWADKQPVPHLRVHCECDVGTLKVRQEEC
ncbi:hypothetical protein AKJ16_DCAP03871 [Drosera capensis]